MLNCLRITLTVIAIATLAFFVAFELAGRTYFYLYAAGDADGPTEISAFIMGLKAGTVTAVAAVACLYLLRCRIAWSSRRA